jgi:hypothetical protein
MIGPQHASTGEIELTGTHRSWGLSPQALLHQRPVGLRCDGPVHEATFEMILHEARSGVRRGERRRIAACYFSRLNRNCAEVPRPGVDSS